MRADCPATMSHPSASGVTGTRPHGTGPERGQSRTRAVHRQRLCDFHRIAVTINDLGGSDGVRAFYPGSPRPDRPARPGPAEV